MLLCFFCCRVWLMSGLYDVLYVMWFLYICFFMQCKSQISQMIHHYLPQGIYLRGRDQWTIIYSYCSHWRSWGGTEVFRSIPFWTRWSIGSCQTSLKRPCWALEGWCVCLLWPWIMSYRTVECMVLPTEWVFLLQTWMKDIYIFLSANFHPLFSQLCLDK